MKLFDVATELQRQCQCQLGVASGLKALRSVLNSWRRLIRQRALTSFQIAIGFLQRVDASKFSFKQDLTVRPAGILPGVSRIAEELPHGGDVSATRLVSLMVTESGNSANDAIIRMVGAPYAMVRLLADLHRGKLLEPATTQFLIQTLEQTTTFPGRIKGLLPPGTVVGHKTGTAIVPPTTSE